MNADPEEPNRRSGRQRRSIAPPNREGRFDLTSPIGARVREARNGEGLSLRKLADAIGVSPSLISQIENGKTRPSVQTLYAIANELDVSVVELVADERAGAGPAGTRTRTHVRPTPQPPSAPSDHHVVTPPGDHPKIVMENGVVWERLAGQDRSDVEITLVTYEPGGSSSVEGRLMRHHGTEYAYILEGNLTLHLEFDTYQLTPGCSLQFSSVRPHMYVNDGTTVARGVWFSVGRHEAGGLRVVSAEEQSR